MIKVLMSVALLTAVAGVSAASYIPHIDNAKTVADAASCKVLKAAFLQVTQSDHVTVTSINDLAPYVDVPSIERWTISNNAVTGPGC